MTPLKIGLLVGLCISVLIVASYFGYAEWEKRQAHRTTIQTQNTAAIATPSDPYHTASLSTQHDTTTHAVNAAPITITQKKGRSKPKIPNPTTWHLLRPGDRSPSVHTALVSTILLLPSRGESVTTLPAELVRIGVPPHIAIGVMYHTLDPYEAHVYANAYAHTLPGHTLILETNSYVQVSDWSEIEAHLQSADKCVDGRWDVLVLGQNVYEWYPMDSAYREHQEDTSPPVMRLLHNFSTHAYIVHKRYAATLARKWQASLAKRHDREHRVWQQEDVWLGFTRSWITKCAQPPFEWACDSTLTQATTDTDSVFPILLNAVRERYHIAVCLFAYHTPPTTLTKCIESIRTYLGKPHRITIIVFSHVEMLFSDPDVRLVHLEEYQALYRFHYMLRLHRDLEEFDYVLHMDATFVLTKAPPDLYTPTHFILYEGPNRMDRIGIEGGERVKFTQALYSICEEIELTHREPTRTYRDYWMAYLQRHPPWQTFDSTYSKPSPPPRIPFWVRHMIES